MASTQPARLDHGPRRVPRPARPPIPGQSLPATDPRPGATRSCSRTPRAGPRSSTARSGPSSTSRRPTPSASSSITSSSATDASERGDDLTAVRALAGAGRTSSKPDDPDERQWYLLACKRAEELENAIKDRRAVRREQLQADRRGLPRRPPNEAVDDPRASSVEQYGKYTDLADLFAPGFARRRRRRRRRRPDSGATPTSTAPPPESRPPSPPRTPRRSAGPRTPASTRRSVGSAPEITADASLRPIADRFDRDPVEIVQRFASNSVVND